MVQHNLKSDDDTIRTIATQVTLDTFGRVVDATPGQPNVSPAVSDPGFTIDSRCGCGPQPDASRIAFHRRGNGACRSGVTDSE
jgi:hypothetical protein